MLKALIGLFIAGAAALAIASPAAAAPVCNSGEVIAYGGDFPTYAAYAVYPDEHCDGYYELVSVGYSLGDSWVYWNGSNSVLLDGIYNSSEYADVTVSDGYETTTFTLTITPCYSNWYC